MLHLLAVPGCMAPCSAACTCGCYVENQGECELQKCRTGLPGANGCGEGCSVGLAGDWGCVGVGRDHKRGVLVQLLTPHSTTQKSDHVGSLLLFAAKRSLRDR